MKWRPPDHIGAAGLDGYVVEYCFEGSKWQRLRYVTHSESRWDFLHFYSAGVRYSYFKVETNQSENLKQHGGVQASFGLYSRSCPLIVVEPI